ncbi:MAG TPA: hypothetical protein VM582_06890 [Candidatus Thermoplasmatota archaeon]|nr:hypothetical protein [Candidatus Thermoplasmatota archaeon]
MTQNDVNVRNVLVLLGIIITTAGLIYFATEFVDLISDWGRFLSLGLLTVIFVSLGLHFDRSPDAGELLGHRGWRWLKVTNALYVLGAIGALSTTIAFFAIDDLDRVWKALGAILGGLGLILAAARRWRRPVPQA